MKIYLDGIEISDRSFAAIDPSSIERIEVIRGPEAATIYGSDAIGGVMQVFTKRGNSNLARPQIDLSAALGTVQSPYSGFSGALRQQYTASLQGGTPSASYNLGGGYNHTGAWVEEGQASIPSGFGSLHVLQGPISIDLSARYYEQKTPEGINPLFYETGFAEFAQPFHTQWANQEQTYGVHVTYSPTPWWRNNFTVGTDRFSEDGPQTAPRFTTPADSTLALFQNDETKSSIAYNTSFTATLSHGLTTILTAGVDGYHLAANTADATSTLNISGAIQAEAGAPPQLTRDVVTNAGVFGQLQVDLFEALFVTGGLRAEHNSSFGSNIGTPLSPRIGGSYVRELRAATLKLRGSYGESIQIPGPDETEALSLGGAGQQRANPLLGPERQTGWDGGADLDFGTRGSISATYFDQVARDLIDHVLLDAATQTYQFQNVARVRNMGVELEATVDVSTGAALRAQYAYTDSRPEALDPGYTGDLRVGQQVFVTPHNTAGASLHISPIRGTSLTAGVTYVSSWVYYDYLAEFRCLGGTGPCPTTFTSRAFLTTYPGFAKVNVSVAQDINHYVSGFVTVDNLTNNQAYEFLNLIPVLGRITMVGVRARY